MDLDESHTSLGHKSMQTKVNEEPAAETSMNASLLLAAARTLTPVARNYDLVDVRRTFVLLCACMNGGGKLLIFGSSWKTTVSQHVCANLVGRSMLPRRALPAFVHSTEPKYITTTCAV